MLKNIFNIGSPHVSRALAAALAVFCFAGMSVGADFDAFARPAAADRPETWFHIIGGNVTREGLTADLEALAAGGVSGIQFFHGQFGGAWPGVEKQIPCLSEEWGALVAHVADECRRLGLTLKLQNCPGWSMSGGPWVKPADAMRRIVYGRTDLVASQGGVLSAKLPRAKRICFGRCRKDEDADYRDICVLAFPTPLGDDGSRLKHSSTNLVGDSAVYAFEKPVTVRTVEVQPFGALDYKFIYEPAMRVKVEAAAADGSWRVVADEAHPSVNWMYGWGDSPWFSIACDEFTSDRWRMTVSRRDTTKFPQFRLLSAARPDNWEILAGWQFGGLVERRPPAQDKAAYVRAADILDVTSAMKPDGAFAWTPPRPGRWTILRVGHVNLGTVNAPAPKEATGWECSKLERRGAEVNFAGYVGRLVDGPLKGKGVKGVLIDSWECGRQSWSDTLEADFRVAAGYDLRAKIPALFGWVIDDIPSTERFLRDWRRTIGSLVEENYYRRMAELCHEKGLEIQYETAFGDVIHGDILKFWKYADTPMCEFWQPHDNVSFVGSYNFKPVRPCVSSAHVYGKRRVAAEALTSFNLTWNEDFRLLKGVADKHFARGVTHLVFHTYTHNPLVKGVDSPGTSFGSRIGTPFLRNQTWWRHMPEFTSYAGRVGMMLERGLPCVDVLWVLGDAYGHKPDENPPFPEGHHYDYINTDALMTRLDVSGGRLSLPGGMTSRVLWIPSGTFLEPATQRRVDELAAKGATVVRGGAVELGKALAAAGVAPDVTFASSTGALRLDDFMWYHRVDGEQDIYFVATGRKGGVKGAATFRARGKAEVWNPVTGRRSPAHVVARAPSSTTVAIDLPECGSAFIVFAKGVEEGLISAEAAPSSVTRALSASWRVEFPAASGKAKAIMMDRLIPWKDAFDDSPEGRKARAFSGTAKYSTVFKFDAVEKGSRVVLDLGRVEAWAKVRLNGKDVGMLWCEPYAADVTDFVRRGDNALEVEVTSTWHNKLVYDAGQPEAKRETWTIAGPKVDDPYYDSGLLGPVALKIGE